MLYSRSTSSTCSINIIVIPGVMTTAIVVNIIFQSINGSFIRLTRGRQAWTQQWVWRESCHESISSTLQNAAQHISAFTIKNTPCHISQHCKTNQKQTSRLKTHTANHHIHHSFHSTGAVNSTKPPHSSRPHLAHHSKHTEPVPRQCARHCFWKDMAIRWSFWRTSSPRCPR